MMETLAIMCALAAAYLLGRRHGAAPVGTWTWTREPRPPGTLAMRDENLSALWHIDQAAQHLAGWMPTGRDMIDALDRALQHMTEARRAVHRVDPELRPQTRNEEPVL